MNRGPILALTLKFLVAAMLLTPAAAVAQPVGTDAANSRPKPNDAFARNTAIALVENLEVSGESYDANDMLYSFESSADYDPAPNLHVINEPMLTINFADDLTNPPQFLNLPTASNYTAVMIPGGPDSFGHMTIAHPAVWASALQSFLMRLPQAH
jgi:hypothetical protein